VFESRKNSMMIAYVIGYIKENCLTGKHKTTGFADVYLIRKGKIYVRPS